jgi:hypothetical protein
MERRSLSEVNITWSSEGEMYEFLARVGDTEYKSSVNVRALGLAQFEEYMKIYRSEVEVLIQPEFLVLELPVPFNTNCLKIYLLSKFELRVAEELEIRVEHRVAELREAESELAKENLFLKRQIQYYQNFIGVNNFISSFQEISFLIDEQKAAHLTVTSLNCSPLLWALGHKQIDNSHKYMVGSNLCVSIYLTGYFDSNKVELDPELRIINHISKLCECRLVNFRRFIQKNHKIDKFVMDFCSDDPPRFYTLQHQPTYDKIMSGQKIYRNLYYKK